MLRITQISSAKGAQEYFDKALTKSDYYITKEHQEQTLEIVGQWHGKAASMLGLTGQVDRESFHALCDNLNPQTGEKLTPRTHANRRVGYDFTFSAKKSISVIYAIADDDTRTRIRDVFRNAVRETMEEIESGMKTQSWKGSKKEKPVTGNMVWAEFIHTTTRPVNGVPDPHLHTHAFAFNATYDHQQQRFKAGEFSDLKRDAPYYQAAFDARLAEKLQSLGYGIRKTEKGWEIAGVSDSVIKTFSNRTQEIEKKAKDEGITDTDEKAELGARTRKAKQSNLSMNQLESIWKDRLTGDERDALSALGQRQAVKPHTLSPEKAAAAALDYAKRHAFERASTISEKRLMAEALKHGVGKVRVDALKKELARQIKRGDIVTGTHQGQPFVTTREVLREEKAMIDFAKDGRGTCKPLFAGKYQYQDALFRDPTKDTAEQRAAIEQVLSSVDRVNLLRGGAGTGKTTALSEIKHGIEQGGKQVFAFAPTAKAVSMLQSEGFDNAQTLQRLLVDEDMQTNTRGQVIWVDESGLVGTHDMKRLFDIASTHQARVILSGDTKQHQSVGRGDAQRILENYAGLRFAEITKIRRQKSQPYRKVVADVQNGQMERAFGQLDRMGAIREIADDDRYQHLADDYLQAVEDKKSALVISPTHREGEQVTDLIRDRLRQQERLGTEERTVTRTVNLNWTEAERRNAALYREGMVVQFHQNAKGITRGEKLTVTACENDTVTATNAAGKEIALPLDQASRFNVYETATLNLAVGDKIRITKGGQSQQGKRLNNGTIHEIKGFTRDGDLIIKTGRHGKGQAVIAKDYGNLAHGYVVTSHTSQGLTVDRVLLAQSTQSFPASSREQWYVSLSRGRESVTIYTDDKQGLMEQVRQSGARVSATELTRTRPSNEEGQFRQLYMAYLIKIGQYGARLPSFDRGR